LLSLSKTDYLRYLQCPKLLWLQKNRKELAPKITEVQQSIFDQGYIVENYARKLKQFANGIEVFRWYKKGHQETQKYIRDGYQTIFQANAMTEDLYCKADILHFDDKTNKWDIYEVKSSTQIKEEHLPDLCFQKIAFEKDGIKIGRTFLVLVNNKYVKEGDIKPEELLKIEDLTQEVEDLRSITEKNIPKALEITKLKHEFEKQIGKQCKKPYKCPFEEYCWKAIPDYSIFDLQRITEEQLKQLQTLGIERITNIPDDFKLTENQQNQVVVTKSDETLINKEKIKNTLDKLKYPLYFLDYETYSSAIPLFDGLRPYQQAAFQYSLHIVKEKEGELEHYEYLHTDKDLPFEDLLSNLRQQIGNIGSIIVWNKSFEMGRNNEMAEFYPQYTEFLSSVNNRIFDLMEIFKDQYYVSPEFKGSYSIKKVLPVLVPKLSYSNLEDIQEGSIASLYWFKYIYNDSPKKKQMIGNMLKYCKLDTLAMVEIWKKLKRT